MKASVLVLASIFFAPVALAQPTVVASPAEKIKILSWNIFMLPGFLGYGKVPRAEAIGQLLAASDYDVIVFQEAFHRKARKKISRLLQPAFPFQAGPANQKLFSLKTNSGLWIVSRHAITDQNSITFKMRSGIDAMSRKGGLMVEIKIHNNPVQIIGAHLQNAGDEWRRQGQCFELFDRLLKKYERQGVPQIICGDFNIDRYESAKSYRSMLQTLDALDGDSCMGKQYSYDRIANDMHVEQGSKRDLIDYILIRPNQAQMLSGNRIILARQQQWHERHRDLSDHYSIEAELFFQRAPDIYTVSLSPK